MSKDLLITSIRKHADLNDSNIAQISEACKLRRYGKSSWLVTPGEICSHAIFIVDGCIKTYFVDLDGREHIIQLGIRGWWAGDLRSFCNQVPATLTCEAIEDVEALLIPYDRLQQLYQAVPAMERYFRIVTQNAFANFQERMLQNLSMDAQSRFIAFREAYPFLESRLPQKEVAAYLGMSAEFLSKIKKRLRSVQPPG